MAVNLYDCGQIILPKGDRYSPNSGLRVRVFSEDNQYDNTLLHNVDVLVDAGKVLITVAPRIYINSPFYPKNIILYLGSSVVSSPVIKNSIQCVVRVKETKQVLANKTIGKIGDTLSLIRNSNVSNNFAITFEECDILNRVDLNTKTLQFEIYSLCSDTAYSCCEKLPSNMYLYNVVNINCTTSTTTTTTTANPNTTTTISPTTTSSPITTTTQIPLPSTTTTTSTSSSTTSTTSSTTSTTSTTTSTTTTSTTGAPSVIYGPVCSVAQTYPPAIIATMPTDGIIFISGRYSQDNGGPDSYANIIIHAIRVIDGSIESLAEANYPGILAYSGNVSYNDKLTITADWNAVFDVGNCLTVTFIPTGTTTTTSTTSTSTSTTSTSTSTTSTSTTSTSTSTTSTSTTSTSTSTTSTSTSTTSTTAAPTTTTATPTTTTSTPTTSTTPNITIPPIDPAD